MKVNNAIPHSIRQLINSIKRHHGDCETWLRAYRDDSNYTYFGYNLEISVLKCSYGAIGYSIFYRGFNVIVDNIKEEISILRSRT